MEQQQVKPNEKAQDIETDKSKDNALKSPVPTSEAGSTRNIQLRANIAEEPRDTCFKKLGNGFSSLLLVN